MAASASSAKAVLVEPRCIDSISSSIVDLLIDVVFLRTQRSSSSVCSGGRSAMRTRAGSGSGTITLAPQLGHLAERPAQSSPALIVFEHFGQLTRIGMENSPCLHALLRWTVLQSNCVRMVRSG